MLINNIINVVRRLAEYVAPEKKITKNENPPLSFFEKDEFEKQLSVRDFQVVNDETEPKLSKQSKAAPKVTPPGPKPKISTMEAILMINQGLGERIDPKDINLDDFASHVRNRFLKPEARRFFLCRRVCNRLMS